ncbi:PmoA family protein [Streptomyces sp. NPDC090106]|uniref:DUF6807 domain-containing protein n=1 Tax=Streptomyces sp. NPDC090106 TaxID=3365946 RepID=UPI0037F61088
MSDTSFRIRHDEAATAYTVSVADTDVATYVYRPDAPAEESPKPYFHPLRTLTGAPLTVYRPWDHRWHKGLQMTLSHVSGQNFWGGPTFRAGAPGTGYVWGDNHGHQFHRDFADHAASASDLTVTETLDWVASHGEKWLDETRTVRFHSADTAAGLWALDFTTELTNVRDTELDLGSPTTHGRPAAGYTGLFWRGPRAWTGAELFAADGQGGDDLMGRAAGWAAVTSEHDDIDGGATVIACAGTSSAAPSLTWFARSTQFAALNPSPAFYEEIRLLSGETLTLSHRFVFVDRVLDRAETEAIAERHAL